MPLKVFSETFRSVLYTMGHRHANFRFLIVMLSAYILIIIIKDMAVRSIHV